MAKFDVREPDTIDEIVFGDSSDNGIATRGSRFIPMTSIVQHPSDAKVFRFVDGEGDVIAFSNIVSKQHALNCIAAI